MRFAGFLPLLAILASYKHADGDKFDEDSEGWKIFNSNMERQAIMIDDLATIIEDLARIITNQEKAINDQSEIIHNLATNIEELKEELNKTLLSTGAIQSQLKSHEDELLFHDNRLKSHVKSNCTETQLPEKESERVPKDCVDIQVLGGIENGMYTIFLNIDGKEMAVDVFCEFGNNNDIWLVFQRRKDGSIDFDRKWVEYEDGFGDLNGEFWLGNKALYLLTKNRNYTLRVDLENSSGNKSYAEYSTFSVHPASEQYLLTVGEYSGTAGDSLQYHNGMKFSTKDVDNDRGVDVNCAVTYKGGWWYDDCSDCNLNSLYSHIYWDSWREGDTTLTLTEMKIARQPENAYQ